MKQIVKLIGIIDTRDGERIGDKWYPTPGTGEKHFCDVCGAGHEIHALLEVDGKNMTVGVGCARKRFGLSEQIKLYTLKEQNKNTQPPIPFTVETVENTSRKPSPYFKFKHRIFFNGIHFKTFVSSTKDAKKSVLQAYREYLEKQTGEKVDWEEVRKQLFLLDKYWKEKNRLEKKIRKVECELDKLSDAIDNGGVTN